MSIVSGNFLIRLFGRHYDDPVAALQRMERNLAAVELPFSDFYKQLRELPFPPQPCLPKGLPSLIYYFVPGSKFGTAKPQPADPLNFYTGTADGIGLNMGCPVRLARALEILSRLKREDCAEAKAGLRAATKHLDTVEEILWLSGWKSPSEIRRGDCLAGKTNVDWFLKSCGYSIQLEAKFRPSDWPAHSDQGTFQALEGSLLSGAAKKFPIVPKKALHVIGITGADLTRQRVHEFGRELVTHPQIHAVVYRSMAQMSHIITMHEEVRNRMLDLIIAPSASDFPTNYGVIWNIEARNERVRLRSVARVNSLLDQAVVWCSPIKPRLDAPVPDCPEGAYRVDITRGFEDEPVFKAIPRTSLG